MDVARALHHSRDLDVAPPDGGRAPDGLSAARHAVLGLLRREGPSTATALAAYLHIQPQSLTRLLADLDRRGLITRRAAEADRRQSPDRHHGSGGGGRCWATSMIGASCWPRRWRRR
ncbi:MAG: MarR family transcriptional regulator [Aliidongia sp.]